MRLKQPDKRRERSTYWQTEHVIPVLRRPVMIFASRLTVVMENVSLFKVYFI